MSDKKTATQTRQEYDQLVAELALRTKEWALKNGCYRDDESDEILGYFVVRSPAKGSHKPSWTEAFDEDLSTWADVLDKMFELGIPICAEAFNGHYIGKRGEQGAKVATGINNTFTRAKTAKRYIEFVLSSGEWGYATPYTKGRLADELKDVDLPRLFTGIDQLFLAAGMPVQKSFAYLLIEAQSSATGSEAAD